MTARLPKVYISRLEIQFMSFLWVSKLRLRKLMGTLSQKLCIELVMIIGGSFVNSSIWQKKRSLPLGHVTPESIASYSNSSGHVRNHSAGAETAADLCGVS